MIDRCKVCEKEIPTPELGEEYWCYHCGQYTLDYKDNVLQSEHIKVGNYYFISLSVYKEASVVERIGDKQRIINTIPFEELTHEVALKWLAKLKTYVLFQ